MKVKLSRAVQYWSAFMLLAGLPWSAQTAPVYLDTVTNLEWRQVKDTVNFSFNQMNTDTNGHDGWLFRFNWVCVREIWRQRPEFGWLAVGDGIGGAGRFSMISQDRSTSTALTPSRCPSRVYRGKLGIGLPRYWTLME
jgi:hypothetical protein